MQEGNVARAMAGCRRVGERLSATCRVKAAAAVERWPALGRAVCWLAHPFVVLGLFTAVFVLVEMWLIDAWVL